MGDVARSMILILALLAGLTGRAHADAPRVQVMRVSYLGPAEESAKVEFEMTWVAAVPASTSLDGFDGTLEVWFSNGSRQQAAVSADSAARMARFRMLKPPSGVVARSFRASLTVRFRTAGPAPLTVSRDFQLGQRPAAAATGATPGPVAAEITQARPVAQGCAAGEDCFELKWAATVRQSQLAISGFNLMIDIAYENGTRKTATRSAGGTDRQARLSVPHPSGTTAASVRATLGANLVVPDSKIVTRRGEF